MQLSCTSCDAASGEDNPYTAAPTACERCGAAAPLPPPEASASTDDLVLSDSADLRITSSAGPPATIDAWARKGNVHHWVAWRTPSRDDIDARASFMLRAGAQAAGAVGLSFRDSPVGAYGFRIDAIGRFQVAYWVGNQWGGELVPWTQTGAIRQGIDQPNQLRVETRGVHLRGWINEVLVFSLHDARYAAGVVRLVLEAGPEDMNVLYTQFVVRDAP
jgi:hypothetical protein